MKQRIVTGVLGALGFIFFIYLGSWWYTGLLFLLAAIAYLEYAKMKNLSWKLPQVIVGLVLILFLYLGGIADYHSFVGNHFFANDSNIIILGLVIYFLMIVFSRNRFDLFQMAYLLVGALYIGYGFSFMMKTIWEPHGLALSLLVIFVTWANDSGAYFVGRKWGKRKLWPEISPNKTIEGALGGVFFGVLTSIAMFQAFPELGEWSAALLMGVVVTVVGQIGDLVESALKRSTGVKDSGTILPGHGGVLDRFDSLLYTFIILHLVQLV